MNRVRCAGEECPWETLCRAPHRRGAQTGMGWDGQQQIPPYFISSLRQCTDGFTSEGEQEVQVPCPIQSSALLL